MRLLAAQLRLVELTGSQKPIMFTCGVAGGFLSGESCIAAYLAGTSDPGSGHAGPMIADESEGDSIANA